jgi:FKBP-type peptidyl-prolyl cis-trans isomerase
LKHILSIAAFALALAGCAQTEKKPESTAAAPAPRAAPAAAANTNCKPPPSELVVKDLEPGTGDAVRFRTAVLVGYTGWLYDGCKPDFKGEKFDSSEGRMDFSFMVGAGRVIRGWDQGLIGMKEHGKRLLIIPPDLAYGAKGGGKIPPNSTLVFEVRLDRIVAQPPQ